MAEPMVLSSREVEEEEEEDRFESQSTSHYRESASGSCRWSGSKRDFAPSRIDDLTLLEGNSLNEKGVTGVLKNRYNSNDIYTYCGSSMLVSLNPFKKIKGVYANSTIADYHSARPFELSAHLYSLGESAYHTMMNEGSDLNIVIQGESGSGKTEACKIILNYLAAVSVSGKETERIKTHVLQSTNLLEAFGNATTLFNHNSSRHGKLLELFFGFEGKLDGAHITTSLLEKTRVCVQKKRERNFHVFYQLCAETDPLLVQEFQLKPFKFFRYLNPNYNFGFSNLNRLIPSGDKDLEKYDLLVEEKDLAKDRAALAETKLAMRQMHINLNEQLELFRIVAAVLWLGNIVFKKDEQASKDSHQDRAAVVNMEALAIAAGLLRVDRASLERALLWRTIEAGGGGGGAQSRRGGHASVKMLPQNAVQAAHNRDALAKALYERMFKWLVTRVNASTKPPTLTEAEKAELEKQIEELEKDEEQEPSNSNNSSPPKKKKLKQRHMIGVLDIYGYECITPTSDLEQILINYSNEKLAQLIQRALKEEQRIYLEQGVPWQAISHHDSDAVASLIENKPLGVLALLDEESLFPDGTDKNYLQKMHDQFGPPPPKGKSGSHPNEYYTIPRFKRPGFDLSHFASKVPYDVTGWVDKNRDTVFNDLVLCMQTSQADLVRSLFTSLQDTATKGKLIKTLGKQMRGDMTNLMGKLTQSDRRSLFVRCILPNRKQQENVFDEQLVLDQVKYLGLLEAILVKRQGYAYSVGYEEFLNRFKVLCPKTWPTYKGNSADGCKLILQHRLLDTSGAFSMGKSRLFFKSPLSLNELDEAMEEQRHVMASLLQRCWKKYKADSHFREYRHLLKGLEKQFGETAINLRQLVQEVPPEGSPTVSNRKLFVVGTRGCYLVDPSSFAVVKRIPYTALRATAVSALSDNYLLLCSGANDYDSFLGTDDKQALLKALADAYKISMGRELPQQVADYLEYCHKLGSTRAVKFEAVKPSLFSGGLTHGSMITLTETGDLLVQVKADEDIFGGKKLRRRASINRTCAGDYCRLQQSKLMQQLNADYGDSQVLFSCVAQKYNKKYKEQERVIMITDLAVYNLEPQGYLVNRRIPLKEIKSASTSSLTDGFFILGIPTEYDYLLSCTRKSELLRTLADAVQQEGSTHLRFNVRNELVYFPNGPQKDSKKLTIFEDPQVNETTLITTKTGAEIHVKPEEVADPHQGNQGPMDLIQDIYGGRKQRRRASLLSWYTGDYLHFARHDVFKQLQLEHGDSKVLFSAMVNKISRKYKVQERVFVVTDTALYTLDPTNNFQVIRRIPLESLSAMALSTLRDGYFVLRCQGDSDLLCESDRKTEVTKQILDAYKRMHSTSLPLVVDDLCEYSPEENTIRLAQFFEDNSLSSASLLEPNTTGVRIHVNNVDLTAEKQGLLDRPESVYAARKMRNRKSLERIKLGDYLRLADTSKLNNLLAQFGDNSRCLFSSMVDKVNPKYKKQQRIMVVTEEGVYSIDPDSFTCRRRVALSEIDGVSLSSLTDGFFCMHVPNEYDYLIDSDKKTEIVDLLSDLMPKISERELAVNVGDKFDYKVHGDEIRSVSFVVDNSVAETCLDPLANGLVVRVRHEEPQVVLESALIHIKDQRKPIEVKSKPITIKMKKKWRYKIEMRFYVNEPLKGCSFHEKIDTVSSRKEYVSQVNDLEPRDERYVILLPERPVLYSVLSKTSVKCKLMDPTGKCLLAVRFIYDVR